LGKEYKLNLPGFKTEVKVGGEGTTANFTQEHLDS
jgi:hypothetical protein